VPAEGGTVPCYHGTVSAHRSAVEHGGTQLRIHADRVAWRFRTMRIHFERSGGFAGPAAKRACSVDTDTLPPPEAEEVQSLVRAANLSGLAVPSSSSQASPRPDAFRYRLVIEAGGQRHTFELSDADVPAPLRPLIHWLLKRATPGGS
jgi:hypothetical protein